MCSCPIWTADHVEWKSKFIFLPLDDQQIYSHKNVKMELITMGSGKRFQLFLSIIFPQLCCGCMHASSVLLLKN